MAARRAATAGVARSAARVTITAAAATTTSGACNGGCALKRRTDSSHDVFGPPKPRRLEQLCKRLLAERVDLRDDALAVARGNHVGDELLIAELADGFAQRRLGRE